MRSISRPWDKSFGRHFVPPAATLISLKNLETSAGVLIQLKLLEPIDRTWWMRSGLSKIEFYTWLSLCFVDYLIRCNYPFTSILTVLITVSNASSSGPPVVNSFHIVLHLVHICLYFQMLFLDGHALWLFLVEKSPLPSYSLWIWMSNWRACSRELEDVFLLILCSSISKVSWAWSSHAPN